MDMRQFRYRAVIALDPAQPATAFARQRHGHRHHGPIPVPYPRSTAQTGPGARSVPAARREEAGEEYFNHTRQLVLRAESREKPGYFRDFAAEVCWDDELPLHPGDRHVVTVTITDDEAPAFLGPGRPFTLWNGAEVGHGTISRKTFALTEYGPF